MEQGKGPKQLATQECVQWFIHEVKIKGIQRVQIRAKVRVKSRQILFIEPKITKHNFPQRSWCLDSIRHPLSLDPSTLELDPQNLNLVIVQVQISELERKGTKQYWLSGRKQVELGLYKYCNFGNEEQMSSWIWESGDWGAEVLQHPVERWRLESS